MKFYLNKVAVLMLIIGSAVIFTSEAKADSPNLILNPSLEIINDSSTIPSNWMNDIWGTNNPTMTYESDGFESEHSVMVKMENYVDGDAKWHFEPVTVEANQDYVFTNYYKSNVATQIVAMSIDAAGMPTYYDIAEVVPVSEANWTKSTYKFKTLPNTKTLTILHVINKNGWLQTDNFSLVKEESIPETPSLTIPNPSLELISSVSTIPTNWMIDIWGTNNPTMTYENNGFESEHSVMVKMENYVDGDAKWHFEPITVEANQNYIFSNAYKSNVPTKIVAMSIDASGIPTYYDIAENVPASETAWSQTAYNFKTLANTKTLTIFHLIDKNGWLQTDNFNLVKDAAPSNLDTVPNNSMETPSANVNLPKNWKHSKWGTNVVNWQYVKNAGHDGTHSVKLTVKDYVSGDAKWVFTPIKLEGGKDYKFTAWYKTNTTPHVVVQYTKNDGTTEYFGMPDPIVKGTDWQQYSGIFHVGLDVKDFTVFMLLNSNGWLQTDDYHVTLYKYEGFDKARVTLTFDDGFEKNISTVLPVLNKYNMKATICTATQYVEGLPEQERNIQIFAENGNELCSHSVTHPDLTTMTKEQIDFELSHSQAFLQNLVKQPITSFVSPFGAYNSAVNEEIKKYYTLHRTTDEGYNSKDNFDQYRLQVKNMLSNTSFEDFQAWVNQAKNENTWLVLLYHVIDNTEIGEYDTYKVDFDKQMEWLSQSGVAVQRLDMALAEVIAQK